VANCFKANTAILNSLLTAMEERYFDNGPLSGDIPLITMVGASNESPEDQTVAALFDRFHFRFWVNYVNDDNVADVLLGNVILNTSISPGDLETAQLYVDNVQVPGDIVTRLINVRRDLRGVGIPISDRRLKQIVRRAMAASAVLNERDEITDDDAYLLPHLLVDKESDLRNVSDIVFGHFTCSAIKAEQILDGFLEMIDGFYDSAQKDSSAVSVGAIGSLLDKGRRTLKKLDKLDANKAGALRKRLKNLSAYAQKLAGLELGGNGNGKSAAAVSDAKAPSVATHTYTPPTPPSQQSP
jgi:MoxR-like ATPase